MCSHLPGRVLGTSSPSCESLTVLVSAIISLSTMSFCQGCGTKVFESARYCHNCGAAADLFENGIPEKRRFKSVKCILYVCLTAYFIFFVCVLFTVDRERDIIEQYFHLGYKYDVIGSLMRSRHDLCMDVRTLKRRLAKYKLSRNESWRNEEEVKNIIKEEMRGSGCLAGYRKMWHLLKIKYNVHVPRNMVAKLLHDLDPEASSLRTKKKLRRRHYLSHGQISAGILTVNIILSLLLK